MLMNENGSKNYLLICFKIVSVLLAASVLMLIGYLTTSNLIKNNVLENSKPIIDELSGIPGVNNVEIKICASPDEYNMPRDLTFHVFLTVHFSYLGQIGNEKALEILNNGEESVKTESSYDWEKRVYARFTRSVTDSIFVNAHPVFVTLTDGDRQLTIKEDRWSEENALHMGDAYNILRPPQAHKIISIFIVITILISVVFFLLICMLFEKKRELEEIQRKERENLKSKDTTIGLNHILREIDNTIFQNEAFIKKEKIKKVIIVLTIVLLCVAFASFLLIKFVVLPTTQYNKAFELIATGKEDEAYAIFRKLDNFKDAKDICNNYDYREALSYLDAGHPEIAFYMLNNIEDFNDAELKAKELSTEYPHLTILNADVGDRIVLGTYEQDNNIYNGTEDIEWIVLKNEGGVLYAVSKYILDAQVYNTHNGDGSTLKIWLKDGFYNTAFSEIPKGFVRKVGLLSPDDMSVYHEIANTTPEWTIYAKAQGPEKHYYAGFAWWLDGEYSHGFANVHVGMNIVTETGLYSANSSEVQSVNGVRPAIIIDCTTSNIDYYAQDYEEMENAGVTTRTEWQVDAEVNRILGR